jgi:hypothetical protein
MRPETPFMMMPMLSLTSSFGKASRKALSGMLERPGSRCKTR